VTEIRSASTAGADTVPQGDTRATIVKAPLVYALIAVVSFSVTLLSFSAPSGADQISSLQAQAAQVSTEVILEQLQIGGYQQQYAAAIERSQQDGQLAGRTRTYIERDQQRIGQDVKELQRAVVTAYVDGGTTANTTPLFTNQQSDGAQSEYEQMLVGQVSTTADQLRSDRQSLQVQEASLQRVVAQDQVAQSDAQSMLQQSQSTQQQLQQQSAQVSGQLEVAVAQQQVQQAAAAAAAVSAAEAKAAAAQKAEIVVGNQTSTAGSSTAAPALNPFLRCVVQDESGGDYQAVSPNGEYMGAFQFSQSTWNDAATLAGRPDLVGVPPNQASPADQDALAVALYSADGRQPWYDPCST
jgi:hypothetical protein